jgi:hypothetical protein
MPSDYVYPGVLQMNMFLVLNVLGLKPDDQQVMLFDK